MERDTAELDNLIKLARIDAESKVIVSDAEFSQVFRDESSDAMIIFMGFSVSADGVSGNIFNTTNALTDGMPPVIMVSSNGEAELSA